ncbi:hypothetical protein SEA_LILPHARAOH_55 [Mycobacterium phage LilPharaoh]|uniref:Uncharacterized protein n=1 Tax=Mycobacterium phage Amelie TaxID=1913035 RepID=A0A1J0GQ45_9CAUD|nr:hypothetical protein AVV01_gp56 [Mycobacterium phage Enkosi]YP_009952572.1 hypothetical protein I5G92_gp54 [Mycobacterium phage Amelie]ATN90508.1 hypothetical protein SEA_LILPHARAOH_55 [Mycobacterium phage LilPharaoh]AVP42632.1 hypothetical protein SEA_SGTBEANSPROUT_55 [Mycobacterium phage SgtBeansprout]AXC37160.1 hypothetical protein SEA_BIGLEBOPS_54 [Mycobacterium phage Biglebops]QGJ93339.1 hypothetical protein PBI_MDAVU_55 [Mycobacterium phage Mdavu]UQS94454.1 hypothetical protein SEA_N
MSNDSYDFLGGGGVPSGKFVNHGDVVGGVIAVEPEQRQQTDYKTGDPLFWKDGSPRMQLVVTLQTDLRDPEIDDDDGKRRLFVKGEMKKAVQKAVIAAGARGLDVGGELHVTYVGDGEKKGNLDPPKLYSAVYKPPAAPAVAPAAAPAQGQAAVPEGLSPEALAALASLAAKQ